MLMVSPALGETSIPPRVRLAAALGLTLVIFPVVRGTLPALPGQPFVLAGLVTGEILVGVFIGLSARLIMSGLHVAGTVIAFQSGLAAAQGFDPSQGTQSALVGSFMTLLGVTLVFVADLHHLLIAAMADSYTLFPPGHAIPLGDFATIVTHTVSASFLLGIQISAPFLVYGLVFYIGLGLLARLMPQLQVFFVAMPLNIGLAFVLLLILIPALMTWFMDYFTQALSVFIL
jgi:flagellar biosynthetic protein FliR